MLWMAAAVAGAAARPSESEKVRDSVYFARKVDFL